MTLLKIHSKLEIRKGCSGIGVLNLPVGLPFSINVGNPTFGRNTLMTGISPGEYRFDPYLSGYTKIRGELFVDGKIFHTEVMSYYSQVCDSFMPLTIKLWDIKNGHSFLYVVKTGVEELRGEFGSMVDTTATDRNGPFTQHLTPTGDTMIECIVRFLQSHIPEPIPLWTQMCLGLLDSAIILIPLVTMIEYFNMFSEIIYGPSLITSTGSMIESFYEPFKNSRNLSQFIGMITGDIPYQTVGPYCHSGTYISGDYSYRVTTFDNTSKYDAVLRLLKIPFDHFDINIDLVNCCNVLINELDTMAGAHFPFMHENIHGIINGVCCEFVSMYFEPAYLENNVAYYDVINNQRFVIDSLHIRRTTDEFVLITITSGTVMYELVFDLILLMIMTPTFAQ